MNQIPENCIEKFVKSYNNYPSIIELKLNNEDIDKLTKNKTVLWSYIKMIGSGVDTSYQEVSFGGPIYEAYLNYVEEGGKEEFDYFRMYIWQQK